MCTFTEVDKMTRLSSEQIKKIADAIRVAVTDEEAEKYAAELSEQLKVAGELQDLNTDEVEPTTHGNMAFHNVMRKDEPKHTITQEEALNNAPEHEDGHFKVPAIME